MSFENNQRSQWELFVSNLGSNRDRALCSDWRGACVEKTNYVSRKWFVTNQLSEKEECFKKGQKVGQRENEMSVFV